MTGSFRTKHSRSIRFATIGMASGTFAAVLLLTLLAAGSEGRGLWAVLLGAPTSFIVSPLLAILFSNLSTDGAVWDVVLASWPFVLIVLNSTILGWFCGSTARPRISAPSRP